MEHAELIATLTLAGVEGIGSQRLRTLVATFGSAQAESSRRAETVSWGRGYYAGSVGWREIDAVRRYIARQHSHHPNLIPPG